MSKYIDPRWDDDSEDEELHHELPGAKKGDGNDEDATKESAAIPAPAPVAAPRGAWALKKPVTAASLRKTTSASAASVKESSTNNAEQLEEGQEEKKHVDATPDRIDVVLDAGPLIRGTNISHLGNTFWTVPEVLSEIRDKEARRRLELLPFEIKTKEPSEEAIKFAKQFSVKTGDYARLIANSQGEHSRGDMKLIALAVMLEWERNGDRFLRREPNPHPLQNQKKDAATSSPSANVSESQDSSRQNGQKSELSVEEEKRDACETNISAEASEDVPKEFDPSDSSTWPEEAPKVERDDTEEGRNADAILKIGGTVIDSEKDGGEWITTKNMERFDRRFGGIRASKARRYKVGVVTTDFTVQNVLMQMGVKILTVDGMAIRRVKKWALKCHACTHVDLNMSRKFCENCGNDSLIRVSVSVDQSGSIRHFGPRRPVNIRGTQFTIPIPKGGRDEKKFIMSQDELEEHQRKHHHRKQKEVSIADPDFEFGATRPLHTLFSDKVVVGYSKKNPNESKKRTGKKKKSNRM